VSPDRGGADRFDEGDEARREAARDAELDARLDEGADARRERRPSRRPRAGPWLPNGFTLANLGFGIFAIISASHGRFHTAVVCIVLGGVCDLFDGAVARATRTGSQLGEQLDSLVDAVSFGLAPAMIVYYAVLPQQGWGWLPVFVYAASAVFRLARFNVTQAGASKTYFIGLPSPAAGGTLATYYWFTQTSLYQETRIVDLPWQEIMPGLMLLLAAMMSSTVPYPSWPKVGVNSLKGFLGLLGVLAIVVGSIFFSKYFFFLFGVSYVAYGLLRALLLGLFDVPGLGTGMHRRASDRVDPMTSYGMHPEQFEAEDTSDRGFGRRRRKRRRVAGDSSIVPTSPSVRPADSAD
jgi:CDP-diacylglycerol--serine O-phosphatidyltransferase